MHLVFQNEPIIPLYAFFLFQFHNIINLFSFVKPNFSVTKTIKGKVELALASIPIFLYTLYVLKIFERFSYILVQISYPNMCLYIYSDLLSLRNVAGLKLKQTWNSLFLISLTLQLAKHDRIIFKYV